MTGREPKTDNDLFFVCSLIEYIARKTHNRKSGIVRAIGKDRLTHILELADVYHSENMDKLTDELVTKYHIASGQFDNIVECRYNIPTHWDIGKVFKRLILAIHDETNAGLIDILIDVFNSPIANKIDDLNSSMYYENPSYIFESYKLGKPCED